MYRNVMDEVTSRHAYLEVKSCRNSWETQPRMIYIHVYIYIYNGNGPIRLRAKYVWNSLRELPV